MVAFMISWHVGKLAVWKHLHSGQLQGFTCKHVSMPSDKSSRVVDTFFWSTGKERAQTLQE
jgi:hypothetical protein